MIRAAYIHQVIRLETRHQELTEEEWAVLPPEKKPIVRIVVTLRVGEVNVNPYHQDLLDALANFRPEDRKKKKKKETGGGKKPGIGHGKGKSRGMAYSNGGVPDGLEESDHEDLDEAGTDTAVDTPTGTVEHPLQRQCSCRQLEDQGFVGNLAHASVGGRGTSRRRSPRLRPGPSRHLPRRRRRR